LTYSDLTWTRLRRAAVIALALSALSLSGCSTTGSSGGTAAARATPVPSVASGTTPSSTIASRSRFPGSLYVSIGDSYAAGYQPTSAVSGGTSRNGFAYQVAEQSQSTASPLQLVNFGCSGATSSMVVTTIGCTAAALGPDGTAYPDTTQAAAAVSFLAAHRGAIGLVTIIIGGNDVKACLTSADSRHCMETVVPVLRRNLAALVKAVRAAVDPAVPVVGLTYPDVFLGVALQRDAASITLAKESLVLFSSYLNPALRDAYAANGARFLDITSATGAYGSAEATQESADYGTIPTPVAQICTLTFYCQYQDIHPRTAGYRLIATLVVQEALR
jgi:lysophospholipase L1-like esterase